MKHDNEVIILIEYLEDIPASVCTEDSTYHFDMHAAGWLMYCCSALGRNWREESGKKIIDCEYPLRYCNPEKWKIWIDRQYTLIPEIQKGVTLLERPLMLSFDYEKKWKFNNPFDVAEEVDQIYYCEECRAYYNEDGCPEHGKEYE